MTSDEPHAVGHHRRTLEADPNLASGRRNLAVLLVRLGRLEESLPLWHSELLAGGLGWMNGLVSRALRSHDLGLAGAYATIVAALRWGSRWYPTSHDGSILPPLPAPPVASLTLPKLHHDIEQFRYLQAQGVLGEEFKSIIINYERMVDRLTPHGAHVRRPLDDEARQAIGDVYNRIVHVRFTPRVRQALARRCDFTDIERQYFENRPGFVVVDDLLSDEALISLRLFCLESTVWSSNNHPHGRLAAHFQNGFNCPLLLQIAEEIRTALPRVIGERYALRHMWGDKSAPHLPDTSMTHADFAAVNVNFWITPEESNLDKTCGGLVVYGIDAPRCWGFDAHNVHPWEVAKSALGRQHVRKVTIPYRQNRAVIFDSNLFHGTAKACFRPGYVNRRVSLTMLYGDRETDADPGRLGHAHPSEMRLPKDTWRSVAFSRTRGNGISFL